MEEVQVMKLTKAFMVEVLQEVVGRYETEVCPLGNEVRLAFMDKDEFLSMAKENRLIQGQIKMGLYRNFEEEYPNFLVVLHEGKHPVLSVMGLPYRITVCFDIARKRLKPYHKEEVRQYLHYVFAHELTHIVQEKLKDSHPHWWHKVLVESKGNVEAAHELLAEDVGKRFGDYEVYRRVEDGLWGIIHNRIRKMERSRR